MTYSIVIERRMSDPIYYKYIKTWEGVTKILKHGLSSITTAATIYKYSSDNKCLGQKRVTMGNLVDVATSPNDKCLL